MSKPTYYICTECGFKGTDDEFDRHTLSEAYDYGHNNAEPAEVELQCPECGLYEEDGIEEACQCADCLIYYPFAQIRMFNGKRICEGCLSYSNQYDITKKGDNHVI